MRHDASEFAQRRSSPGAHVVMRDHANRRSNQIARTAALAKFGTNAVGGLAGFGNVNDHDVVTTRSGSILIPGSSANPTANRLAFS